MDEGQARARAVAIAGEGYGVLAIEKQWLEVREAPGERTRVRHVIGWSVLLAGESAHLSLAIADADGALLRRARAPLPPREEA